MLLEVLTGRHPLDPSLPGGMHLVQWAREHLQSKRDPVELLDARLRGRPDHQTQEIQQALAIASLCVGARAEDRPTMKDVAALLKEIRRPANEEPKESAAVSAAAAAAAAASPVRNVDLVGSSNCSFAMSDYSS